MYLNKLEGQFNEFYISIILFVKNRITKGFHSSINKLTVFSYILQPYGYLLTLQN